MEEEVEMVSASAELGENLELSDAKLCDAPFSARNAPFT